MLFYSANNLLAISTFLYIIYRILSIITVFFSFQAE